VAEPDPDQGDDGKRKRKECGYVRRLAAKLTRAESERERGEGSGEQNLAPRGFAAGRSPVTKPAFAQKDVQTTAAFAHPMRSIDGGGRLSKTAEAFRGAESDAVHGVHYRRPRVAIRLRDESEKPGEERHRPHDLLHGRKASGPDPEQRYTGEGHDEVDAAVHDVRSSDRAGVPGDSSSWIVPAASGRATPIQAERAARDSAAAWPFGGFSCAGVPSQTMDLPRPNLGYSAPRPDW